MSSSQKTSATDTNVSPLRADDLDAVVKIDKSLSGTSRRGFFEKRLTAAMEEPRDFVFVGLRDGDQLIGYALARLVEGEFGRPGASAALDAIGVAADHTGENVGHQLIAGIEEILRHKEIGELTSQVDWKGQGLIGFLASAGFAVAPRIVLTRATDRPIPEPLDHDDVSIDDLVDDSAEFDFSSPDGDDFEALSRDRIPVRSMAEADLGYLVAIDRRATGQDRSTYYRRKLREAMHESGVRISLVAELDGQPVGFIMARVEFGEFGHADPEAVMDTIGIDPGYRRAGVARALMSQLIANLATLRVDHVRTELNWNDVGLINYLDNAGFVPAQCVVLSRKLS
jgi:ribosomal protein S18 acetylase RimI-like enzyme